ncbi:MAG: amidohydrolase family protein [Phycisphaerales bacterium]|nr:amidohydrolase family protein [Phycisphaerales bacterium]
MNPPGIVNAVLLDPTNLRDAPGLWTIRFDGDRIGSVEKQNGRAAMPCPSGMLDARRGLVVPSLVDAHVHLDLAYSLTQVPPNDSGTLLEAIELWQEAKSHMLAPDVCERALRAVRDEIAGGTGYIRSHVDVGSMADYRLCEGVLAARQQAKDLCFIELVAFPQDGLMRDPGAVDHLRRAMRDGVNLVGGIPHIESTQRDGLRHLEMVFDLAAEFDADIDVHIDETDDPHSVYAEYLASMTMERGWQNRVTASHVCALGSYPDAHASRVIDLIAAAQIAVVTNPGVNLHLQGRFDRYPKRRGLTRVSELLARGVPVAAGQDCIADPFYPLGNGKMLDQAFLLVHADHMNTSGAIRQAFDMVSGMAGRVIGLARHAIVDDAPANLAVFDAEDVIELVRVRPTPHWTVYRGRVVAGTAAN